MTNDKLRGVAREALTMLHYDRERWFTDGWQDRAKALCRKINALLAEPEPPQPAPSGELLAAAAEVYGQSCVLPFSWPKLFAEAVEKLRVAIAAERARQGRQQP